ncbi:MAG: histidine kinase [Bacteroidota bacterium]
MNQKKIKWLLGLLLLSLHSNYVKADHFTDSLLKVIDTGSLNIRVDAWLQIADYYTYNYADLGYRDLDSTFKYYSKSLESTIGTLNLEKTMSILNRLGWLLGDFGEHEKALRIFEVNYYLALKYGLKTAQSTALLNMGICYFIGKNFSEARRFINSSICLSKQLNHYKNIGIAYTRIGQMELLLGNFKDALVNLEKSIWNFKLALRKKNICFDSIFINKGYMLPSEEMYSLIFPYLCMSETFQRTGNFHQALAYCDTAMLFSYHTYGGYFKREAYLRYYEIFHHFEMKGRGLPFLEYLYHYKDSLYSSASTLSQSLINMMRETKERKFKSLQQENQIVELRGQRTLYISIAVMVVLFLVIIIMYLVNKYISGKRKHEKILLEQKALQLQMNPHFVSNMLSAIQRYIMTGDKMKAVKYVSDFSDLMRLILKNSRTEFIPVAEELKLLAKYMELQEIRFPEKFKWKIEVDSNIDQHRILIPPMFIQPLVENSIEHGIAHLKAGGLIFVKVTMVDCLIKVEVTDNGIGRKKCLEQRIDKIHFSYSTQISEDRLTLSYRNRKSEECKIVFEDLSEIDSANSGTRVYIKIPFKKQSDEND